jgi:hypothetical protein
MLPEDLLQAYAIFTTLATKHGFAYAGMMIGSNPPSLTAIGNVTETGHELVRLLREYADILEEKINTGQLERPMFRDPN